MIFLWKRFSAVGREFEIAFQMKCLISGRVWRFHTKDQTEEGKLLEEEAWPEEDSREDLRSS